MCKPVVGLSKRPQLESYAAEMGGAVYIDSDSKLYRQVGEPSIPAFIVLDGKGRMIKRQSGLPRCGHADRATGIGRGVASVRP